MQSKELKLTEISKVRLLFGLVHRKAQTGWGKGSVLRHSLATRPSWALDLKFHVSVSLSAKGR